VTIHLLRLPTIRSRLSLNSSNPIPFVDVILLELETSEGIHGLGFTYSLKLLGPTMRFLFRDQLIPLVVGESPLFQEKLYAKLVHHFRSVGFSGILARCYSAIDIACWDIKAKVQKLPLYQLLGNARSSAKGFLSDVATLGTEISEITRLAKPHLDQGALGLMVASGSGDIEADADRIHEIRHQLGESIWLAVTAQEGLDLTTALGFGKYLEEEGDIEWFDHPIPTSDTEGYRRLANHLEVPLSLGASLDSITAFRNLIEQKSVRILRPDPIRLGGITPILKLSHLTEAYHLELCPYRLPEIGVHLGCGLPNIHAVDYVNWLSPCFTQPIEFSKGFLSPSQQPGLGLELNSNAVQSFGIS
jgi:L-alanine-DL-glutamate epimerase-like enolase superfamily enzyme